jgi:hypothetical protein
MQGSDSGWLCEQGGNSIACDSLLGPLAKSVWAAKKVHLEHCSIGSGFFSMKTNRRRKDLEKQRSTVDDRS